MTSSAGTRLTQYARGGGAAGKIPGVPLIGELVPGGGPVRTVR
jgi:hypothetical protein